MLNAEHAHIVELEGNTSLHTSTIIDTWTGQYHLRTTIHRMACVKDNGQSVVTRVPGLLGILVVGNN